MIRAAALLRTLLETITTGLDTGDQPASVADARTQPDRASIDSIAAFIRLGQLGTLAGLIQAVELLGTVIREVSPDTGRLLLPFVEAISTNARVQLRSIVSANDESRRLWTIMDLTLATMRGILRHNLATHPRGFDAWHALRLHAR